MRSPGALSNLHANLSSSHTLVLWFDPHHLSFDSNPRYISHRSDRERVVVELLQFLQDEPGKGHDVPSITALLYPDIPKANVALVGQLFLFLAARLSPISIVLSTAHRVPSELPSRS